MNKYSTLFVFTLLLSSPSLHAGESLQYHFDLGTWFGGDKLAQNPDGDDYKAGSGAAFGLGLQWRFSKDHKLFFRNNLGYRYQGAKFGDGGNRGIVYESSLVKTLDRINLVGGFHVDINAVTKDYTGNRIEYDNAVGQYIGMEYMALESFGFGIKYLLQDYKLSNGRTASGNQFGLFLTGTF